MKTNNLFKKVRAKSFYQRGFYYSFFKIKQHKASQYLIVEQKINTLAFLIQSQKNHGVELRKYLGQTISGF